MVTDSASTASSVQWEAARSSNVLSLAIPRRRLNGSRTAKASIHYPIATVSSTKNANLKFSQSSPWMQVAIAASPLMKLALSKWAWTWLSEVSSHWAIIEMMSPTEPTLVMVLVFLIKSSSPAHWQGTSSKWIRHKGGRWAGSALSSHRLAHTQTCLHSQWIGPT